MDSISAPKRQKFEPSPIRDTAGIFPLPALLIIGIISTSLSLAEAQVETSAAPEKPDAAAASDLPSDEAILKRLPELSTDYIRNLLGVYARLGNADMSKSLTAELNRRNPGGANEEETPESIASEAMDIDNDPPNPYEAIENQIDAVMSAQKYAEAIVLMEKLRAGQFSGKPFPFEIELGDAYGSTGNFEGARAAYTRAASAPGASSEQKKLAQAGLVEIEKLESLKIAYDLIDQKQPEEALRKAEALRNKYPEDIEVQLLYAQALVPNYHYLEALPMLEAIKAKHFVGKPYPAQDALAETLRASGRLDDARAAYDELSRDNTLPEHIRAEAVIASRDVAKMRSKTLQGSAEFLSEGEGDAVFFRGHASAPIAPGLHAGVDAWYYDISLSSERSLRQTSGDFLGAVGFVRKYLDDNLSYLEARAGGGDHGDATLGFTIGKEQTYLGVLGYDLSVDVNTPALDSLQLIALNGIEDRVGGNVVVPLPGRFEMSAGAFGRTVEADGADLGSGWGAYFEVARPIWENVKHTSAVTVAYRADYESFEADRISDRDVSRLGYAGEPADGRNLGEELIEPLYHPHGLQVTYESRVTQSLFYYVSTGLFFDFADEEWDYNLSGGLEYALTDMIDLVLEGGYYSDGTGASNDDSEVFVGTIGIRSFY
jgi:tetratricopeptide (TPR) repeat protein